MEMKRIDEIIDKHEARASALVQVLLEIQSENHWLPKEALERGEPAVVVAERVEARGMFWLGFWVCVGMIEAAFVAAAAYLKRHRILPTRR